MNEKVANNRFYGLSKEFEIVPYTIPKSNLGLRRYKFMTCPMRVLYYAIGFICLNFLKGILNTTTNLTKIALILAMEVICVLRMEN